MADRYADILNFIVKTLEPVGREVGITIGESTRLSDELGLDSLRTMDLIMEVEDHYDLSIPINLLGEVSTCGELARGVEGLLPAG